jgi:sialate O-acetylesterase
MRVWFDHAAGLTFRDNPAGGFELAGLDHMFKPADARLENDTVVVSSGAVPHPLYVRYGWMGVVTSNLYNAAGLPTSTFTSESNPVH